METTKRCDSIRLTISFDLLFLVRLVAVLTDAIPPGPTIARLLNNSLSDYLLVSHLASRNQGGEYQLTRVVFSSVEVLQEYLEHIR